MKILYLTDDYAWDAFGVKRSLCDVLRRRAEVGVCFYHQIYRQSKFGPNMRRMPAGALFDAAMGNGFSHVFFASSGLAFEPHLMEKLRRTRVLVGFGFSDPRFVEHTKAHWHLFDAFFTLSREVCAEAEAAGVCARVMLPSIHPGYHDRYHADHANATFDVIHLGNVATHPDAPLRRQVLDGLRASGTRVCAIGKGGDTGHVEGDALVRALACGRVGLNLMNPDSTLPHRLFEYAAAGLCVVSTMTPEIEAAFAPHEEIVPFDTDALHDVLADPDRCARIARNGRRRCLADHTMEARARDILDVLATIGPR